MFRSCKYLFCVRRSLWTEINYETMNRTIAVAKVAGVLRKPPHPQLTTAIEILLPEKIMEFVKTNHASLASLMALYPECFKLESNRAQVVTGTRFNLKEANQFAAFKERLYKYLNGAGWVSLKQLVLLMSCSIDVHQLRDILLTSEELIQEFVVGTTIPGTTKPWTSLDGISIEQAFQSHKEELKKSKAARIEDSNAENVEEEDGKFNVDVEEEFDGMENKDVENVDDKKSTSCALQVERCTYYVANKAFAEFSIQYGLHIGSYQNVLAGVELRRKFYFICPEYWISWNAMWKASKSSSSQKIQRELHAFVEAVGHCRAHDALFDEIQFGRRKDDLSQIYVRRYPGRVYPAPCVVEYGEEVCPFDIQSVLKLAFSLPSTLLPERVYVDHVFPSLSPLLQRKSRHRETHLDLRELATIYPTVFATSYDYERGHVLFRSRLRERYPLLQPLQATNTQEAEKAFEEILNDASQEQTKKELFAIMGRPHLDPLLILSERVPYYCKSARAHLERRTPEELCHLALQVLPENSAEGLTTDEFMADLERRFDASTANTFFFNAKGKHPTFDRFFASYPELFSCKTTDFSGMGEKVVIRRVKPSEAVPPYPPSHQGVDPSIHPEPSVHASTETATKAMTSVATNNNNNHIETMAMSSPQAPADPPSVPQAAPPPEVALLTPEQEAAVVEFIINLIHTRGHELHFTYVRARLSLDTAAAIDARYKHFIRFVRSHPFHLTYNSLGKTIGLAS